MNEGMSKAERHLMENTDLRTIQKKRQLNTMLPGGHHV